MDSDTIRKNELVDALRQGLVCKRAGGGCTDLGRAVRGFCICLMAANEIERLRARIRKLEAKRA